MKKAAKITTLCILLLSIAMLFTIVSFANENDYETLKDVKLLVNGRIIQLERELIAINGRILAPARTVFAQFGARVDWYPEYNLVNIVKDNTFIGMFIGQKTVAVNKIVKEMDCPPVLLRGTVMVPVRFVADALNIDVQWFGNIKVANLGSIITEEEASRSAKPYSGKIVVIDPGHGGYETGAVHGGIKEKDLNLDIALRLEKLLKNEGIIVYMTRKDDRYVNLYSRSGLANSVNADMLVSIHNNADWYNTSGTMTLYYPETAMKRNGITSKDLAAIIQKEVSSYLGTKNIGIISRTNLAVLRTSKVPAVIVEVGYMTNKNELKKLSTAEYRQKAAEAIRNGILKALR
ncbi:MAG TPA: N-acetylmuramoyl-L-alanine amidase [Clostridiaceae bacterium]|nr:N-acetylmuramoyl-L-alanine amidase [Clostridiaceae bacterium]